MTQSGSSIQQGDPGDENDAKTYGNGNPTPRQLEADLCDNPGDWTLEQTEKADEWFAKQGDETLPTDSEARKGIPITTGVLDYFPAALAAVAAVSKAGNDKHNPGEPLHWARGKSMDQADCIGRHLIERGGVDLETGMRHSAQLAWRALALLQLELEEAGEAPLARGAFGEAPLTRGSY